MGQKPTMPGYPIELVLRGRTVLVVGLGAVGRRKAAGLVAAGARVLGVDPTPPDALARVEVRAEPYRPAHLDGVWLVLACASPAVNHQVVDDARNRGIWVSSASDPDEGDFTIPAVWRSGPLLLTVSTSGASPALASTLRDRAAEALGPEAAALASLLAELRPEVLTRLADNPDARRRLLAAWADPRWLDLCRTDGPESVRHALVRMMDLAASDDTT
jgi:precorrin-2 dehydrogenase/sirohydrochlorin ferrochelatase